MNWLGIASAALVVTFACLILRAIGRALDYEERLRQIQRDNQD
jgi:hypothetical protein